MKMSPAKEDARPQAIRLPVRDWHVVTPFPVEVRTCHSRAERAMVERIRSVKLALGLPDHRPANGLVGPRRNDRDSGASG